MAIIFGGFTSKERDEAEQCARRAWGKTKHGFIKTTEPGMVQVTTFIPDRGRVFIRGREVLLLDDRSLLGEEYFLPAGAYAARILS